MTKLCSYHNSKETCLIWFRDDLRLRDNQALTEAVKEVRQTGKPLIALYLLDDKSEALRSLGSAQQYWLHHSLTKLKAHLLELNIPLFFQKGDTHQQLLKLCGDLNITEIFWNRRYSDGSIAVDSVVKSALSQNNITCNSYSGYLLHEPWQIKTGKGDPYKVYTPFWRNFSAQFSPTPPLSAPKALDKNQQSDLLKLNIGDKLKDWKLLPENPNWAKNWDRQWQPGEENAHKRLGVFLEGAIHHYKEGRDIPSQAYTSKMSPHLRFGEISPNQIWYSLAFHQEKIDPASYETYQKELVWREFAYHLQFHWPNLHQRNFNKKFDHFPWIENQGLLERWKKGRTGYPIVDAGMRQLWQEGWMHNRVRMVVASFLVKHLMIDWRHGERWFWDCLLDADPASNPVSWQWVAGCGADASPYFRIFNPYTQAQKFDPNAEYIKTYVSELQSTSANDILKPPKASQHDIQLDFKSKTTYSPPIVAHDAARKRALEALKTLPK